ncbi:hypothetical protein M0R89_07545 [Halorussus limi]|uniref:Uncharacterized protein n=1 Tax=Halorussus limi TaxID=2938695 RepID=A0A8U0HXN8_9EURY|nr:hypothetical protein [Halorussus limi]UPV75902.1 hypothetical protein M0R89_07545 [Halorussus limi]
MKVRAVGETRTGRAVDLGTFDRLDDVSVPLVADSIRRREAESGGDGDDAVVVECPTPGPVHAHVGAIRAETDFSLRPALAAAARSQGHTAPQDDELAAIRDRLDSLDVSEVDLREARRRVAETSDAAEELRERVAAVRGRVRALREADADPGPAESDLADATRRLSEAETERIAAEQALSRARERARADRERRRERLRLEDRAANLRRRARERLADVVRDAFEDARAEIPEAENRRPPVESALAVARVADLAAPVAVAREVDPFGSADATSEWLDAPVIRV